MRFTRSLLVLAIAALMVSPLSADNIQHGLRVPPEFEVTEFADGNSARIFRVADGGKLYAVRLRDLVKRGDITANVDMRPGDILIIPQSWF